jgi:hypothetical protein
MTDATHPCDRENERADPLFYAPLRVTRGKIQRLLLDLQFVC